MRHRRAFAALRRGWLLGLVLALAGCAGASPPLEPPATRAWVDVPYASGSAAQRLDLYLPPEGEGPFPVVVWVHGGSWRAGSKALGPDAPQRMVLAHGYALASVEYRLTHEATFPAQVHDVKAAVRWLRAHGRAHRLDTSRIAAWGGSAGGHLAALLGTSGGVAALEGGELGNARHSSRVQAVVSWYGPTDFPNAAAHAQQASCPELLADVQDPASALSRLLGGPLDERRELARAASPVTHASADDPPFLLQHGTEDCTVPYPQSVSLADALRAHGGAGRAELDAMAGQGHGGPAFTAGANRLRILRFLDRHLR